MLEVFPPEDHEHGVLHGDHMRRPWLLIDDGHLPEHGAFTEDRENHLPAIFRYQDDFDLTRADQVHGVAGIVFEDNDTAARVTALTAEVGECLQVRSR